MTTKTCTRCYGNVRGDAAIGDKPYCHPDEGNSCYEDQLTENFVLKVVTEQGYADHCDVAAARKAAITKLIAEGIHPMTEQPTRAEWWVEVSDRLPLSCRLRRHGWRLARPLWSGTGRPWTRKTCRRCRHLKPPFPKPR